MFTITKVNDRHFEIRFADTGTLCAVCNTEKEANVFTRTGYKKVWS